MAFTTSYPTTTRLDAAVTDTLTRLGDLDNEIWGRAEISDYLKDAYDQFCGETKCLFDIHVIENLPVTGNWQTDLEKQIASTKPGFHLTDQPFHFTGEHERDLGTGGKYAQTLRGPASATNKKWYDADNVESLIADLPTKVPGGLLPEEVIDVIRVTYDNRGLQGMASARLKELDPNYETRSGDPQVYTFDKDGIYFLRIVPAAGGQANYDDTDGTWGKLAQRLDSDSNVEDTIVTSEVSGQRTGGWGIIRHRTDFSFANGGTWGHPTRIHPEDLNIDVEVNRLGRDLDHHAMEIPLPYVKYVLYWAMYQALDREGSGQQLEMAKHYRERFEMGVARMKTRKRKMNLEHITTLMRQSPVEDFGLGEPQAPYPFGEPE